MYRWLRLNLVFGMEIMNKKLDGKNQAILPDATIASVVSGRAII